MDGPTPSHEANNVDIYQGPPLPNCLSQEIYRLRLTIDDQVVWRIARKVLDPDGGHVETYDPDQFLYLDAHHGLFWAPSKVTLGGSLHLIQVLPDRSTWESPDGKLIPPKFTNQPPEESEKLPTGWLQRWLNRWLI